MATIKTPPVAKVVGLGSLLRVMRDLPKAASADLRDRAQDIADRQAQQLKRVARAHPDARVRAVAETIRSRRDRLPVIAVGGARRMPLSGRPQAGEVLFGTEFGADQAGPNGWRFPAPATGDPKAGHWLYPTLRANHDQVVDDWTRAYGEVLDHWSRRPAGGDR